MVIDVKQSKTFSKENFEVYINGVLANSAKYSSVLAVLSSQLMDASNNVVFRTSSQLLTDLKNMIPFKWVWDEKLSHVCTILDRNEETVGKISHVMKGVVNGFYRINYLENELLIYSIDKGNNEYLLIFQDGKQIGEVVKNLTVQDNLDAYKIHLLDSNAYLADILKLFVVYYDNMNYSNRGNYVKGMEKEYSWSISKYNELYNPNWLEENKFPIADDVPKPKGGKNIKKVIIITSIIAGLILAIVISIFVIVIGALGSAETSSTYDIGQNSIPSINAVVGQRKISGLSTKKSNSLETKDYTYSGINNSQSDILKYIDYLHQYDNFIYTTGHDLTVQEGRLQLAANASESGKKILIDIKWDVDSYTVALRLTEGTLNQ